jgi:hypothetical protein
MLPIKTIYVSPLFYSPPLQVVVCINNNTDIIPITLPFELNKCEINKVNNTFTLTFIISENNDRCSFNLYVANEKIFVARVSCRKSLTPTRSSWTFSIPQGLKTLNFAYKGSDEQIFPLNTPIPL